MRVTYKLHVPVYVTVDLREGEVERVVCDDSAPVGGWRNVDTFGIEGNVVERDGLKPCGANPWERALLDRALDLADKCIWPSWSWGW